MNTGKEIMRREIEFLIKDRKESKKRLVSLAYKLYKEEIDNYLDCLPVERHGYKKVLRALGFVIWFDINATNARKSLKVDLKTIGVLYVVEV